MTTLMRFLMVLLTSMVLSGCATKAAVIGGPDDMLVLQKGTVIKDVKLPTADGQLHDVVTAKTGFWISTAGWNRVEKVCTGSSPVTGGDGK